VHLIEILKLLLREFNAWLSHFLQVKL
jgi:hypothetical protein